MNSRSITMQLFLALGLFAATATAAQSPASSNANSELSLFGSFRGSLNQIDDPICDGHCTPQANQDYDGLSFRNNASIIGLRGAISEDDLRAYFTYILRAHNDEIFNNGAAQTIIYTAGINGPWGDLSYGVGSTPYKVSGMKLDPFWDSSASARGFDGPGIGLSDLTWGFSKNLLQYHSDQLLGALRLESAVIVDDSNADRHDFNLGLSYRQQTLSGGAQLLALGESQATAKSPGKGEAARLWIDYQQRDWRLSASAESLQLDQRADQTHLFIAASVKLSAKNRLAISYGSSSVDDDIALDGQGGSIGLFREILPKTTFYILLNHIARDQAEDRNLLALGASHQFSWGFK